MKNFILTAILVLMVIAIPTETQAGPFERYLDCVEECMDKYKPWTLRLSACAADCYAELMFSPVKGMVDVLTK